MSKHTPAPWVIDDDNRTYVGIAGEFADGYNYAIIAETAVHSVIGVSEAIANARLIAAAPDMLEALEKLMSLRIVADAEKIVAGWNGPVDNPYTPHPDSLGATLSTTCGDVYDLVKSVASARAAIAKAKEE